MLPGVRSPPRSSPRTDRGSGAKGSTTTRRPSTRHAPATNPSTRNVWVTSPFMRMTAFRYCSGSTRVRSAHESRTLSHFGQEPNRRRRFGVRQRRAWNVQELPPVLVTEAPQRLEPLERAHDLGHVHHAPGTDVTPRGGAEGGEVATDDLRARLRRIMRFRLVDGEVPLPRARVPECRLVVMEDMGAHARSAPGAQRFEATQPVLVLDVGDNFPRRHRARGGECPNRRSETLRLLALVREVRLAEGGAQEGVVTPGEQVQRLAHHRRLDDRPADERALERLPPKACSCASRCRCKATDGHWACTPTRCSITAVGESRFRSSKSWRASVARFSSRNVRTRSGSQPLLPPVRMDATEPERTRFELAAQVTRGQRLPADRSRRRHASSSGIQAASSTSPSGSATKARLPTRSHRTSTRSRTIPRWRSSTWAVNATGPGSSTGSRLLLDLADHRLGRELAGLDPAARDRPVGCSPDPPAGHEQLIAEAEDRRRDFELLRLTSVSPNMRSTSSSSGPP